MSLSNYDIERLHNSGKMPDWYYYQVNGKSIEENYAEIYNKRQKEIQEQLEQERFDALLEKEIDRQLPDIIEKALKDLFKGFSK